jgi:hypothetical protein
MFSSILGVFDKLRGMGFDSPRMYAVMLNCDVEGGGKDERVLSMVFEDSARSFAGATLITLDHRQIAENNSEQLDDLYRCKEEQMLLTLQDYIAKGAGL